MNSYEDFGVPLSTDILEGLYMGGTDESGEFIPKINYDLVITHYKGSEPYVLTKKEHRLCFPDSTIEFIDLAKLHLVVEDAFAIWKDGGRVLIRCQAGLNRSGLTTAIIPIESGFAPDQAIDFKRAKRSKHALFNHFYTDYILTKGEISH